MIFHFIKRNRQFWIFAAIGVLNTTAHGVILTLAVERMHSPIVLAHLFAFSVVNIFSYFMNSRFTFKVGLTSARYVRFLTASLLSLFITLFLAWIMDSYGFHYFLGFVLIVFLVPIFNFMTIKFFVFVENKQLGS